MWEAGAGLLWCLVYQTWQCPQVLAAAERLALSCRCLSVLFELWWCQRGFPGGWQEPLLAVCTCVHNLGVGWDSAVCRRCLLHMHMHSHGHCMCTALNSRHGQSMAATVAMRQPSVVYVVVTR
jgi:hypothetical protein